jgi:hypothetical protein
VGLLGRLRRRPPPPPVLDPADPDLQTCVVAFDPARADSAVLAEAAERGVDLEAPVLVRHHVVGLPDDEAVVELGRLVGAEGYVVRPGPDGAPPRAVLACRTEVLTALSLSRERSRMAGAAQRLGGSALGWDAQRPSRT